MDALMKDESLFAEVKTIYENMPVVSNPVATTMSHELDYIRLIDGVVQNPDEENAIEKEWVGVELATGDTSRLIGLSDKETNPDALVQKKGLAIYDDMKRDATVKAVLFVKKFTRLSTGHIIKPASDSSQDVAIAKFYERQLEQIPGTVMQMLLGMMTSLDYGYSIMEENYYFINEGEDAGKIGLASVKSKKPHDFNFKLDNFSNIEALIQEQNVGKNIELPPDKFLIMSWMPEWENPYGIADLRSAYQAWWQKDVLMRFQAMFLERYAGPILWGTYPPGTDQVTKNLLLEIMEDIQFQTVAIKPEGVDIEDMKLDRSGSELYAKAISYRDTQIARAMLVPELLGFTDKGATGSFALGKKQFDLFLGILKHLGRTLEEVIREQLTIPFIKWNFSVTDFPEFKFLPLTEESPEIKAKILSILVSAGLVDAEDEGVRNFIVDFIGILPEKMTKASEMAKDSMTFDEAWKFVSPDGKEEIEAEVLETYARTEKLMDALEMA